MMIEGAVAQFSALDDSRCAGKVEDRLVDVLVIAVCAVNAATPRATKAAIKQHHFRALPCDTPGTRRPCRYLPGEIGHTLCPEESGDPFEVTR